MKERLRLVTDFAELRAGMIVVHRGCLKCGARNRGVLLKKGRCALDGGQWSMEPSRCKCGLLVAACACAVDNRNIYRVEDGLEDTRTTSTSTPAPSRKKARA